MPDMHPTSARRERRDRLRSAEHQTRRQYLQSVSSGGIDSQQL
jgi:hypothetical protein